MRNKFANNGLWDKCPNLCSVTSAVGFSVNISLHVVPTFVIVSFAKRKSQKMSIEIAIKIFSI